MKTKKEIGQTWANRIHKHKSRLGYKTEAYRTEEEALSNREYTYSMLSASERKIFNKLK